jgi:predicted secreted protein
MGKILGKDYRLFIKVSSTTEPLAGETSSNLNLSADVIEVSDKGNSWKEYLAGMKGGTVDATLYADNEDAAQGAALEALFVGQNVSCFFGKLEESGYSFDAIVTSLGESADIGGALSRSISMQITGEVEKI